MKVIAFQDQTWTEAVVKRCSNRDKIELNFELDRSLNSVIEAEVQLGYYVGGPLKGYDVRVVLTTSDVMGLLSRLLNHEADHADLIEAQKTAHFKIKADRLKEIMRREEQLAKRRAQYQRRKNTSGNAVSADD